MPIRNKTPRDPASPAFDRPKVYAVPKGAAALDSPPPPPLAAVEGDRFVDKRAVRRSALARGFLNLTGSAFRCASSKWFGHEHVQVDGFDQLLDAEGKLGLRGPVVWLFSHSDSPADPVLLIGLRNHAPLIEDGLGGHRLVPHFLMRKSENIFERVGSSLIFGALITHVKSEIQRSRNESPEERESRIRANRLNLEEAAATVLASGEHQVIFPEGTTYGDGTIRVTKVGAISAFSRFEGKEVPMVLGTLTYDPLVAATPKTFINLRAPIVVRNTDDKDALAKSVQGELSRLGTLTTTGIIGGYLLEKRAAAGESEVEVSRDELERVVAAVIERAASIPALRIDHDLLEPTERARAVQGAWARIIERGYLRPGPDPLGPAVLTAKLGKKADNEGPRLPKEQLDPYENKKDPLRYWGNRLLQHAHYDSELASVLFEHAFVASPAAGDRRPSPVARKIEGCVIS